MNVSFTAISWLTPGFYDYYLFSADSVLDIVQIQKEIFMWTICQDFLAVSGSVSLFKQKLEAVFKAEMLIHPANMPLHTYDRGKHCSNAQGFGRMDPVEFNLISTAAVCGNTN